ncbi:hypothetical protein QCA50_016185 [Cerrena zonata]|uniref:Uncharacterized protein n=1 Tax=Cerrena zonata TaxID=2478898 RepID=A0AAW0FVZ1_9APHY
MSFSLNVRQTKVKIDNLGHFVTLSDDTDDIKLGQSDSSMAGPEHDIGADSEDCAPLLGGQAKKGQSGKKWLKKLGIKG